MKPPVCRLCGRDFRSEWFHAQSGGELIYFRDYEPLPDEVVGHPRGVEWFCRAHAPAAKRLARLDSSSALVELQQQFGRFPCIEEATFVREPSLWLIEVGPRRAQVLAVIQQITGLTATEALAALRS